MAPAGAPGIPWVSQYFSPLRLPFWLSGSKKAGLLYPALLSFSGLPSDGLEDRGKVALDVSRGKPENDGAGLHIQHCCTHNHRFIVPR